MTPIIQNKDGEWTIIDDQDQEQVRKDTKFRVGKQPIQIQEECKLHMLYYMDYSITSIQMGM